MLCAYSLYYGPPCGLLYASLEPPIRRVSAARQFPAQSLGLHGALSSMYAYTLRAALPLAATPASSVPNSVARFLQRPRRTLLCSAIPTATAHLKSTILSSHDISSLLYKGAPCLTRAMYFPCAKFDSNLHLSAFGRIATCNAHMLSTHQGSVPEGLVFEVHRGLACYLDFCVQHGSSKSLPPSSLLSRHIRFDLLSETICACSILCGLQGALQAEFPSLHMV